MGGLWSSASGDAKQASDEELLNDFNWRVEILMDRRGWAFFNGMTPAQIHKSMDEISSKIHSNVYNVSPPTAAPFRITGQVTGKYYGQLVEYLPNTHGKSIGYDASGLEMKPTRRLEILFETEDDGRGRLDDLASTIKDAMALLPHFGYDNDISTVRVGPVGWLRQHHLLQ
jgi:hypothetical protein